MEQSSLFGDPSPPRLKRPAAPRTGRCRLFFALFPSEAAIEQILELGTGLKGQFALTGKLHAPNRLHLTLDHLGDFESMPYDAVKAACEAASGFQARSSRFSVQLDRVVSFGRHAEKRPLVLRDSGEANLMLKAFRINLWDALAAKDVPGGPRSSFTPHVTLLYDAQVVSEHTVNAVTWEAHEFVLLHSAMQETRYETLGRWPLPVRPA